MSFISWMDSKCRTLNVWDISVLKTYCMLIGMVLGAHLATFVKEYLISFAAVIVVCGVWLCYKFFVKKAT